MDGGVDLVELFDGISDWITDLPRTLQQFIVQYIGVVITFAVGAFALLVGVMMWREAMTHRALMPHHRGRYLVRRAGTTSWSDEQVARWAAQLSMIRRRVRRIQDRPAQAVRVRLEATPHGPRYTIEGSWRLDKVMRNPALPGMVVTRMRPRPSAGQPDPDAPPTAPGSRAPGRRAGLSRS